jgi:hypothetical protein
MAEKYLSFLPHDDEHFLMKASPNISVLHFSVIAFERVNQHVLRSSHPLAVRQPFCN